jgi:PKD repeat protein
MSNQPPAQPINISPADGATDVSLTLTLQSSSFSDMEGDAHTASQWQLTDTSGDYSSPVFDSGTDSTNLTQIDVPAGTLNHETTYYWRVRHQDNSGNWSEWSSETSFTTIANQPPSRPTNVSPLDGAIDINLTPTLQSSDFYDAEGDLHHASEWEITTTPGDYSSPIFDSDQDTANLTSIAIPAGTLNLGTTYYWRVMYTAKNSVWDWSEWSEETSFTTLTAANQSPAKPANLSPADGANDVSLTPTLQSSDFYDADGDIHNASKWEITTTPGDYSNPIFDSDQDTANLTSIVIPTGTLSYTTTYYWRVMHVAKNDVWQWSEWSEETSFTTVSLPVTPEAAFSGTPISGMAPLMVDFSDQSTGNVTSWEWDFNNDGSIDSTVQNPLYIYQTAGTYTVALMVTGSGGSDTEIKSDYITVTTTALKAAFSVDKTSGTVPLTVKFTDESAGNVLSWEWDFNNDGTIDSMEQNPSYTYTINGEYVVSLRVTGPDATDTEVKSDYITVEEEPSGGVPVWVWIVIGIGAVIIVAGGGFLWFRPVSK